MLQGHPRPWPVAKLRTFGDPRPKSARHVCRPWCASVFPRFQPYSQCGHPAASRSSAAGSLRHQKPCVRQSQPHRFCCLRSSVSLRLVQPGRYSSATLPGRARQRCFGRPGGGRSGRWRRHCRFVRWPNRQRLRRWGSVCAGPSAISVYPSNQPCHGPFRPGPRRPSSLHTSWRSLPAAGSLGSPVRGPVKARQRPTRQTASGATLRSRWSLRALGGLETQSREPASGSVGNGNVGGPIDRPAFETLNHQGLLGDLRPKVGA